MEALTTPVIGVGQPDDATEDATMSEIKTRFAGGYEVDAALVAQEILRKLRLVKWARQELVSEAGRTPGRPARGR